MHMRTLLLKFNHTQRAKRKSTVPMPGISGTVGLCARAHIAYYIVYERSHRACQLKEVIFEKDVCLAAHPSSAVLGVSCRRGAYRRIQHQDVDSVSLCVCHLSGVGVPGTAMDAEQKAVQPEKATDFMEHRISSV